MYGEGAETDQTCQQFHAGDFSPGNVSWSRRPAEIDSDQIKTLTESNHMTPHRKQLTYSKYPN